MALLVRAAMLAAVLILAALMLAVLLVERSEGFWLSSSSAIRASWSMPSIVDRVLSQSKIARL